MKPTLEEVRALAMLRRLEREWEKERARIKREDAQAVKQQLKKKS